VLVLLALAGYGLYRWISGAAAAKAPAAREARPTAVAVATARRGDLPVYLNALATVTAYNTVTVRTRIDGQLDKVAFTEGQLVQQGDTLFQIDPRPYRVQLAQANGQFAQANAQLAQAKAQLAQANGQLTKDTAARDNAQLDVNRYIAAKEAVSDQVRRTAEATLDSANGAIEVDKGTIQAAQAAIDSAQAAIESAQAAIESANLNLTYCTITASLTGRVGLRLVDQGNMIHASDPNGLAVITQVDPITVVFSLPQDDLPQVLRASGGDHPLSVEAYSRDLGTRLATGTLLAVDNQIDPGSATVRFKAKFDNQQLRLFPNQFVNVRLLVDTRRSVVLVPASAVQRSPQARFVYVVGAEDKVALQTVKEGPSEGDSTVIEEGLQPGQEVVTDGADKLVPGMKVMRQAATTRAGPTTGSATMPERPATSAPATTRGQR